MVYYYISNGDIYVKISCFIILLFQELFFAKYIQHEGQLILYPTFHVSFSFYDTLHSWHSVLVPTKFNIYIGFFLNGVITIIKCYLGWVLPKMYVSTNRYLLQMIYTNWLRGKSQCYMLNDTDYKNISIENYKREIFQKFML